MRHGNAPGGWRGVEWSLRLAATVVLAGLCYVSLAHTIGYAIRTRSPDRAVALAPADGRVAASRAQKLAGANATPADRMLADRLAREALLNDATAVGAASTLGINAQVREDTAQARRYFRYAERLSRRDLQTQLWAIEYAVSRNDVVGALKHYDIALRTSRNAANLLYPILSQAMTDPVVRSALLNTLKTRPVWGDTFIEYVSGNGSDPLATAQLFAAFRRGGGHVSEGANTLLMNALLAGAHYREAWGYYVSVRGKADRRFSRDPDFSLNSMRPAPFDWALSDEPGISVSIQRTPSGGLLDFAISPGSAGSLVHQMQLLPPGKYRLEGRSIAIDGPTPQGLYWSMRCRSGKELARAQVPNSSSNKGAFSGTFEVPDDCPVQTLTLMTQTMTGLTGQIDRLQVSPATDLW